jgi:predicted phosphodiesterase
MDRKEVVSLQKENDRLRNQLKSISLAHQKIVHDFNEQRVKIGLIGDTHLGSLFADMSVLKTAYHIFKKQGVKSVYHAGDILAGEKMYRGQEYELGVHGADAQVGFCVNNYPEANGITTHFITGNHDGSFFKRAGLDIGQIIASKRPDLHYLGPDEQDVIITGKGNRRAILRLTHPRKGTAYAISYQTQKMIEAWSGGDKPAIVAIGHYHKAEYIFYRNVHAFQVGCIEKQTPFMKGQNIAAMLGFWILDFVISNRGVSEVGGKFFPFY